MKSYICSEGHGIGVPDDVNLKRCPGYNKGSPCKGTLKRVGEGSRADKTACPGVGRKVEIDPRSKKGKGRCPECDKLIALTKESKLRFHEPATVAS